MNEEKVREAIASIRLWNTPCPFPLMNPTEVVTLLEEAIAPEQPERICGLTMDEWVIMFSGRFLCQFSKDGSIWKAPVCRCSGIINNVGFLSAANNEYEHCRPYRAVGPVQPYFDNEECKAYLDGLSDDAVVIRHKRAGGWCRKQGTMAENRGLIYCNHHVRGWGEIDKFIVLSE